MFLQKVSVIIRQKLSAETTFGRSLPIIMQKYASRQVLKKKLWSPEFSKSRYSVVFGPFRPPQLILGTKRGGFSEKKLISDQLSFIKLFDFVSKKFDPG